MVNQGECTYHIVIFNTYIINTGHSLANYETLLKSCRDIICNRKEMGYIIGDWFIFLN